MEASIAKVWGSEALFATADDAVQAFGGYGFSAEYPPEKIYRDNRINRIFEGTNEINRLIIAGALFKKASNGACPAQEHRQEVPKPGRLQRPPGAASGTRWSWPSACAARRRRGPGGAAARSSSRTRRPGPGARHAHRDLRHGVRRGARRA